MRKLLRQSFFILLFPAAGLFIHNNTYNPEQSIPEFDSLQTEIPECDSTLWDRVYDPSRLKLVKNCVEATGVVWGRPTAEGDADYHILIRLDSGQSKLLNKKNYEYKDSCLVAEPVCAVKDPKHRDKVKVTFLYWLLYYDLPDVCEGYYNNIYIPKSGEHVRVTGPLIVDEGEYGFVAHGWQEIHPVTKIELLK